MLTTIKIADFKKYLEQEISYYQELAKYDEFFARIWIDYYSILTKFNEVFTPELTDEQEF